MKVFLLLVCLIATACAISQEQMNSTTGFSNLQCNVATNAYLFTLVNGYTVPNTLIVLLDCTNIPSNSQTFTVPAIGSVSSQISPMTGSIQNHFCVISVYTPSEPFTNNTVVYQSIDSTCGGVTVPESIDGDCNFWAFWCQFDTGQWYYNFICWCLFYIAVILVLVAAVIIIALIRMNENNLLNETRKNHANMVAGDENLRKYYEEYYKPDNSNYSSMRMGSNASASLVRLEIPESLITKTFGYFTRKNNDYLPVDNGYNVDHDEL